MPPKVKHVWTKEQEEFLSQCLMTQGKGLTTNDLATSLAAAFRTRFPCNLLNSTLLKYARDLRDKKRQDLPSATEPAVKLWDAEKDAMLLACASEAEEENKAYLQAGFATGKAGRSSRFGAILCSKMMSKYPHLNEGAIRIRYSKLVREKPTAAVIHNTVTLSEDVAITMRYANFGFALGQRPLFQACCSKCAVLIPYSRKNPPATEKTKSQPLVANFFNQEDLPVPVQNNAGFNYMCSKCNNKTLLKTYAVMPRKQKRPEVITCLNKLEQSKVALCALFSAPARHKNKQFGIFETNVGETNALHKDDGRYFDMYAMIIEVSDSKTQVDDSKIRKALIFFRAKNHLYETFLSHYETMLRFAGRKPGDPQGVTVFGGIEFLPAKAKETKDTLLGDEQGGLLAPAYNLKSRGVNLEETVVGVHHRLEEAKDDFVNFTRVRYSDEYLEAKIFPCLFPYARGCWAKNGTQNLLTLGAYVQWRLLICDDAFRRCSSFYFFMWDRILKDRIIYFNSTKVNIKNLKEPLTKADIEAEDQYDPYARYGTEVPTTIPNSSNFWASKSQDILAMSAAKGRAPDFFITVTQNDRWPEVQAVVADGPAGRWIPGPTITFEFAGEAPVDHPVEMVVAFYRRLQDFIVRVFQDSKGPIGDVDDYILRIEYQKRGGLHAHIAVYIKPGTEPPNVIHSQMPRFDHPLKDKFREVVKKTQIHRCVPARCFRGYKGKTLKKCKYGFPAPLSEVERLDETGIRYIYVREHEEDRSVASYNLALLLLWGGHINIQRVTSNGWEMYLGKYIAKCEYPMTIRLAARGVTEDDSDVKKFLRTRLISSLECCALALQKFQFHCSREIIFLPAEVEPESRFLKRKSHMKGVDLTSDDIYYQTKLQKYLDRPIELSDVTYPDFFSQYYYSFSKQKGTELSQFEDSDSDSFEPASKQVKTIFLKDLRGRQLRKRQNPSRYAITRFRHYSPYGEDLEQYCLVKLLQKYPVTRETVAGLKSAGSYLEECIQRKLIDKEEEAMHFLDASAKRGCSTKRIAEIAQRFIDGGWLADIKISSLLKTVAPYHLQIEAALLNEIDDEEADIMGLKSKRRMSTDGYLQSFSKSQRGAYNFITDYWERRKQCLAFVTGGGGVGKSHLLDALVVYCQGAGLRFQILATTGCAAHLVGGITIHAFLKMDAECVVHLEKGSNEAYMVRNVDVIFIDEASMLELMVYMALSETLVSHSGVNKLFAGKSVILLGDTCQLPPVGRHIWTERYFACFSVLVLKESMRQKDDQVFSDLLNRVRVGEQTAEDFLLLETRLITERQLKDKDLTMVPRLVPLRKMKDLINSAALRRVEGELRKYEAVDVDANERPLPTSALAFVKKVSKYNNLPRQTLELKIGAKVMLTRNRNISHGWCNGTLATVVGMTDDYVTIKSAVNERLLLCLDRIKHEIKISKPTGLFRYQFPLELAYSMTIHKAQGQTMDQAIVSASRLNGSGQFYTAISRVRSLETLFFTELERESILISPHYKELWQWMQQVDVLSGFSGKRPPMPFVPYESRLPMPKEHKPLQDRIRDGDDNDSSDDEDVPKPPQVDIKEDTEERERYHLDSDTEDEDGDADEANVLDVPSWQQFIEAVHDIPIVLTIAEYRQHLAGVVAEHEQYLNGIREDFSTRPESKYIPIGPCAKVNFARCKQMFAAQTAACRPIVTTGDGSCLFHAISICLYNNETRSLDLRAATLAMFSELFDHYDQVVARNVYGHADVRELIHDTAVWRNVGVRGWGTGGHIRALAEITQRRIFTYNLVPPAEVERTRRFSPEVLQAELNAHRVAAMPLEFTPDHQGPNVIPLMVMYSGNHYEAVLPRGPVVGFILQPIAAGNAIPFNPVNVHHGSGLSQDMNVIHID